MQSEQITSRKTYFAAYVGLLMLLGATIAASYLGLGTWGIAIALTIALCKAVLIVLYFMNVRGSSTLIRIGAVAGFVWLLILLALTFNDYLSRAWLS